MKRRNFECRTIADDLDVPPVLEDPCESIVQQHFKDECDISSIIKKYTRTGELPVVAWNRKGFYADVTPEAYQSSFGMLAKVDEYFDALSASRKLQFDNDPAKFVDFITNPANMELAINMGYLERSQEQAQPVGTNIPLDNISPGDTKVNNEEKK